MPQILNSQERERERESKKIIITITELNSQQWVSDEK
jgi:hypothetical protein